MVTVLGKPNVTNDDGNGNKPVFLHLSEEPRKDYKPTADIQRVEIVMVKLLTTFLQRTIFDDVQPLRNKHKTMENFVNHMQESLALSNERVKDKFPRADLNSPNKKEAKLMVEKYKHIMYDQVIFVVLTNTI